MSDVNHTVFGIPELKPAEVAGHPTTLEVKYSWRRLEYSAEQVDKLLSEIDTRIHLLRKWHWMKMVDREEMENVQEWHRIRFEKLIDRLYSFNVQLHQDGSGI